MHSVVVTESHRDERGYIADLLVGELDSATLIFTEKGAVRGNHFHRRTTQWVYVLEGSLLVATKRLGYKADERFAGPQDAEVNLVEKGQTMHNPPYEAHAWKALEPTTVIVLTKGPRSGEGYESDTERLSPERRLIDVE